MGIFEPRPRAAGTDPNPSQPGMVRSAPLCALYRCQGVQIEKGAPELVSAGPGGGVLVHSCYGWIVTWKWLPSLTDTDWLKSGSKHAASTHPGLCQLSQPVL